MQIGAVIAIWYLKYYKERKSFFDKVLGWKLTTRLTVSGFRAKLKKPWK